VRQTAFERSLDPMLVCDDQRRCVDANVAACLFFRAPRDEILRYRIDDLVPKEARPGFDRRWAALPRGRGVSRLPAPGELMLPDGTRVAATLSVATYSRDLQLVVIDFEPVRSLLEGAQHAPSAGGGLLTKREREVLTLVAAGKTGISIAGQLFLSPTTVQTHVNNSLLKLNAKNRAHGIAIALRTGEIELDEPARDTPFSSISPLVS
jgi:DNA-binding CsgD family transcriptional regulator